MTATEKRLKKLGGNIRYFRKRKGHSLEKLSILAVVSKTKLWEIEIAKFPDKNIDVNLLFRIAYVLRIELDDLFRGIEICI